MSKSNAKEDRGQIFVYRDYRAKFIKEHLNFSLTKYFIYDIIRRLRYRDSNNYESTQKRIAKWIGKSEATISYHISIMLKWGILEKTDLGFKISNQNYIDEFNNKTKKGSFTIIDFQIKDHLDLRYGKMTFEQFAVLSFLYGIMTTKLRGKKVSDISRLTLINKNTVAKAIKKFQTLNMIDSNFKLKEEVLQYYNQEINTKIFNRYKSNTQNYKKRVKKIIDEKSKKERRESLRRGFGK